MSTRPNLLHLYPERIAWIGISLLSVGTVLAFAFLSKLQDTQEATLIRREKQQRSSSVSPYSFSLNLNASSLGFSVPDLQSKMTFSFDPPRPDGGFMQKRLMIRITDTGESKRVVLPCRLDLEFQGNTLKMAKEKSLFWIDFEELPNGQIEGKGSISTFDGTKIDAGQFRVSAQECPLQTANEFPEGSAFRALAEAKWWGRDLLRPSESGERIEMDDLLEIREEDWLIWKDEKWQKGAAPESNVPIAHIKLLSPKMLVLEAWDLKGHTRIGLAMSPLPPFKTRPEDLLSTIRIRSEKQVSCMLEKQCMVLKTGDWVMKTGNRWKVLRKKDEKDAFLNGKLSGELFILDQIAQKQGQKVIQGRLFNPGRTQVAPIEMGATLGRKSQRKGGKLP